MSNTVLGVIGGSGVYGIDGLEHAEWRHVAVERFETAGRYAIGLLQDADIVIGCSVPNDRFLPHQKHASPSAFGRGADTELR